MNFTPEQLAKAKAVKSAEELLALAKAEGVALTEEEAAKFFADLHKEGELADEELDNVAGGSVCVDGCTYSSDYPHYLITTAFNRCPGHSHNTYERIKNNESPSWRYCEGCDHHFVHDVVFYCGLRTKDNDPYR